MKSLLLTLFIILHLNASAQFAKNNTCKGCHPVIYNEFNNSQHRKSSIFEDKIHQAAWKSYKETQSTNYSCATCHTPTDTTLISRLKTETSVEPKPSTLQTQEAISCAYCHGIKTVEQHNNIPTNILTTEKKYYYAANKEKKEQSDLKYKNKTSLFGMVKEKIGSPFHTIDYSNDNYYNAKMCMGCHQEIKNSQDLTLMHIKDASVKDEKTNCISCHMPEVKGSLSNIKITKKHRYHGFAGAHNQSGLLQKYVKLSFVKKDTGFSIGIKNEASHDLFLHPLRLAMLKVSIINKNDINNLASHTFEKTYSKNGIESSHWEAKEIKKDTMVKANQKRVIDFDTLLQEGDKVRVTIGYYLIKPKLLKSLQLQDNKEAKSFKILKQTFFDVKP